MNRRDFVTVAASVGLSCVPLGGRNTVMKNAPPDKSTLAITPSEYMTITPGEHGVWVGIMNEFSLDGGKTWQTSNQKIFLTQSVLVRPYIIKS